MRKGHGGGDFREFDEAMTKADHDQLVELRGRPVTQGTRRKRQQTSPFSDGPGVVSVSQGIGSAAAEGVS